jgi:hypothetical protein
MLRPEIGFLLSPMAMQSALESLKNINKKPDHPVQNLNKHQSKF